MCFKRTGWLLPTGLLVVLVGGWVLAMNITRTPPLAQLLGITLPTSVGAARTDLRWRFIGEYEAYVRFEIDRADLPQLLASQGFQPAQASQNPLVQLTTGARGQRSFAAIVQAEAPAWWALPANGQFTLMQRSRGGPGAPFTGPDSAYYIIDLSDPQQATVYVYAVEV
jgi:hypothetical protein